MNQKTFAEKKLKCSESFFSLVLAGKRNFSLQKARRASKLMATSPELWQDPKTPFERRQKAWANFKKQVNNG
jgi:hypothetical protein